jgi:hypothetical protein
LAGIFAEGIGWSSWLAERRLNMRTSKRDAAKLIRNAVKAGWSRQVELSRVCSSDPTSAPWLVMVILKVKTRWDWSQITVAFRRSRKGTWIVSFGTVNNINSVSPGQMKLARGLFNVQYELWRMADSRKDEKRFLEKREISFDI